MKLLAAIILNGFQIKTPLLSDNYAHTPNDVASIEHGGGVFGYSSYSIRIEEYGVYVLILSNFKKESNYSRLVPTIAALTINKLYDYLGLTANINEESGKKYTGTFKTDKGDTLHISMENNRLIMKTKNRESVLQHLKKDTFLIEGALEDRIEFSFRKIKGLKLKRRRSMEIQAIEI